MLKGALGWIVLAVSVTIVAAGGYYYYQTNIQQTVTNVVPPVQQPQASQPAEDLNRKRQEGIGSIKDLKRVEIPPADQKAKKP